jgi:hypothetical protein
VRKNDGVQLGFCFIVQRRCSALPRPVFICLLVFPFPSFYRPSQAPGGTPCIPHGQGGGNVLSVSRALSSARATPRAPRTGPTTRHSRRACCRCRPDTSRHQMKWNERARSTRRLLPLASLSELLPPPPLLSATPPFSAAKSNSPLRCAPDCRRQPRQCAGCPPKLR